MAKLHYHEIGRGVLEKCYHKCRSTIFTWGFWIGLTLGFPLEHLIWERLWPFYLITHWLGV